MASKKDRKKKKAAIRSRKAQTVAATEVAVAPPGRVNLPEAPGGYRQLLRYSQLSVGAAGVDRHIGDVWATFIDDMRDLGVPDEAIVRMERLGPDAVLGGSSKRGFNKSITAHMNPEQLEQTKVSLVQARNAVRGVPDKVLGSEMDDLLNLMSKDAKFQTPEGKRILAELKKPGNRALLAKVGANQGMSVLVRRGDDPWWTQKFNQIFKRKNTAVLPAEFQDLVRATAGGKVPAIAATTKAAVKAAGATGTSLAGGAGRKALGMLGKTAGGAVGVGALAFFEGKRLIDIFGREGRAKKLARAGFEGLGPSSNVDFLRQQVSNQEMVARRKVTMQKFEPELFQEVVRHLSQSGQAAPILTDTERRIGSRAQMGAVQRGRSKEDINFMLDEMFNQMGSAGGGVS